MRGLTAGRRARGAAILAALVALVLLAWQRPDPFARHATVRALFPDAGSLSVVGADVRMAGTRVGRITGRRRAGQWAEVTMQLDGDAGPIHADATAELRPRLAFEGPAYVDLHPGDPQAPALGARAIPPAHTASYVPLDRVLRLADAPTRARLRGAIAGLRGAVAPTRAIRATLGRAPALLAGMESTGHAAQGPRTGALQRAVHGLSVTASAVASRESDLVPLVRSTAATARALDPGTGAALRDTIAALPATTAQLRAGGDALDAVLRRLGPLARELRPGARRLAGALRAARPLLREAGPALRTARPVLADLRAALDAGAAASAPAARLLRTVAPTLDVLDRSLLPALRAPTPVLGIPAYLSFLNLFEGGGGASRPFETAADSSRGTGHFMRFGFRFLTGAGAPLPPCALLRQADPQTADLLAKGGGCTP
jgi:ABC-type transporter Mla subunit MlaD